MAEDGTADGSSADEGPDDDWLARLAAERDLSRGELLARIVDALDADTADAATVEGRLDGLEDEVDAKLRDVRERVIQVKREADEKAPAEHDHPDLEERLERIASDLEAVHGRLDAFDERIDAGFDNYEALLEYLVDGAADADRKLTTLASALLDLRERTDALAEATARRDAAAELAAAANREGIRRARCEECGDAVDIGLLCEPSCPHCDAPFGGVRATRGLFGTNTLETGTPPSLESGDEAAEDLDDLLDARDDPPTDALGEDDPSTDDETAPDRD